MAITAGTPTNGDDRLFGTGGDDNIDALAGNDSVSGEAGNDTLIGGLGNDTLIGGLGNDTLIGGADNDTYLVTDTDDTILENLNGGVDTVQSRGSFTLGANVENLTLTDSGTGRGNELDNNITGSNGSDTLDAGVSGADTLNGGAGDDTYIVTGFSDTVIENLNGGVDTVQSATGFTLGANVENLTLTGGGATGKGNELSNNITGSSGSDTLDGGISGSDTLSGGLGNDTYIVTGNSDTVIENPNGGVDTVQSSGDFTLGANVENLTLTGNGGAGGGNELSNNITGSGGGDILDAGVSGFDTLSGGLGNDTYIINFFDTVIENLNGGVDTVQSSGSFTTLGANVENLILTGNGGFGTGNELSNNITGSSGSDNLDAGVSGSDVLNGGLGNDTYIVTGITDTVIENLNGGVDTVQSSGNFTLGANVENLTLIFNGTGRGNNLSNNITGSSGSDTLDGGVSGSDVLNGGLGSDTYIVTGTDDTVIENVNGSVDTVQSSGSFTLGANVENLTLIGNGNIGGGGNNLNNKITGNSGSNFLDAGFGGTDTLSGGAGNDNYLFTSFDDKVIENLNGGEDTVFADGSFTLGANVENLSLIGNGTGKGNDLSNKITGSGGSDILDGGVSGNDTLDGGLGNDTLLSNQFLTSGNDVLNGGAGNDVLSGGDLIGEDIDILSGGTEADTFVLGIDSGIVAGTYYGGEGHATITDFSISAGDKIDLFGFSSQQYRLTLGNTSGSAAQDTFIQLQSNNDLIAIVQDVDIINIAGQVFI